MNPMKRAESIFEVRGRPKLDENRFEEYARTESVAEPLKRIALAAAQRGITPTMLARMTNRDPKSIARSFLAATPPPDTVEAFAAALGYPAIARRALLNQTVYREARAELIIGSCEFFDFVLDDSQDTEGSDGSTLTDECHSAIYALSEDEATEFGRRFILARHGLDEAYRKNQYNRIELDVFAEFLPSLIMRFDPVERVSETLEDHEDMIKYAMKSMGVSLVDQIKIMNILETYIGPEMKFERLLNDASREELNQIFDERLDGLRR